MQSRRPLHRQKSLMSLLKNAGRAMWERSKVALPQVVSRSLMQRSGRAVECHACGGRIGRLDGGE